MPTIRYLIDDWIEMRATLKRQLELLETGQIHTGTDFSNARMQAAISKLTDCIVAIDALLEECVGAER